MSNEVIVASSATKTFTIGFVTLVLGFLFFLFKIEACKYSPEDCKDRFTIVYKGSKSEYNCPKGSHSELVNVNDGKNEGIALHCRCNAQNSAGAVK